MQGNASKSYSSNKTYKTYLTIGDWSEDGHGRYEKFYFVVNYPASALRQAYKDSCAKTGLQFNHNENYIGTGDGYIYDQIWSNYGNCALRPAELEALREHGIIDDDYLAFRELEVEDDGNVYVGTDDAADIIMRFISLSMPDDFAYAEQAEDAEPINGWWNDELNVQFGYGLYE